MRCYASPNPAAYEAYLKGRHHLLGYSRGGLTRSRCYFEEAIALDSRRLPLVFKHTPHCFDDLP